MIPKLVVRLSKHASSRVSTRLQGQLRLIGKVTRLIQCSRKDRGIQQVCTWLFPVRGGWLVGELHGVDSRVSTFVAVTAITNGQFKRRQKHLTLQWLPEQARLFDVVSIVDAEKAHA